MQALVTSLSFDEPSAADEELAELARQASAIRNLDGFRSLIGIRVGPNQVLIVRVFDTAQGIGRSLATPLRPDLAEHFTQGPQRVSGDVLIFETR